jgi:hypothetical protein
MYSTCNLIPNEYETLLSANGLEFVIHYLI